MPSRILAAALATLASASPTLAQTTRCERFPPGGYVGVFADSLAQDSTIVMTPHPAGPGVWLGSFHVIAVLNGAIADGLIGAQFRVHLPLVPESSFITTTLVPEVFLVLGQMVATGDNEAGIHLAFAACARGTQGAGGKVIVPLARIGIVALEPFDSPTLVKKMSDPDPRAPCPIFSRCDDTFSPAPMVISGADEEGEPYAFRGRIFCDAPVATAQRSWGVVKALYR